MFFYSEFHTPDSKATKALAAISQHLSIREMLFYFIESHKPIPAQGRDDKEKMAESTLAQCRHSLFYLQLPALPTLYIAKSPEPIPPISNLMLTAFFTASVPEIFSSLAQAGCLN